MADVYIPVFLPHEVVESNAFVLGRFSRKFLSSFSPTSFFFFFLLVSSGSSSSLSQAPLSTKTTSGLRLPSFWYSTVLFFS